MAQVGNSGTGSTKGVKKPVPARTSGTQTYRSPAGQSPSVSISGRGLSTPSPSPGPSPYRDRDASRFNVGSVSSMGGGGVFGGGGAGGGTGGGMVGMAAPAVTAPSEEDYLAGDSGYQTQLSALQGALQRYLADSDFQRTNYSTDYNRSLRDLGYDEGTKAWNWNDKLTASGRGYQNQLDDFASRGMLQSQGYADAYQELQRMLGQQYDALSGAKTTFMTDLDNQIANFKGENTANQQAARAEALQRRAAQFML